MFARFASHGFETYGSGCTAGLSFIPQLTKAVAIFPAEFAPELPVADGFADNLTGGRVFPRIHSSFEQINLLLGKSNAHFANNGHIDWSIFYYFCAIFADRRAPYTLLGGVFALLAYLDVFRKTRLGIRSIRGQDEKKMAA
jgi:hypothetical protein